MYNWFETVVKYDKTSEEGKTVTTTEHYLVDALSHAEAENRIIEEMKSFIAGEFVVSKVGRRKINEIFYNENADKFYRAKINFIALDEDRGVEKKIPATMLAQGNDIQDALNTINYGMKGSMADWCIVSITEVPVIDIFKYKE